MKIYFIRHGETLWNTLKIFQGTSNSPLTSLGKLQAKKLGERLKDIKFTRFYSSPMGRAIETSKGILEGRNDDIYTMKEFREISVGDMEGIEREKFIKNNPEEFHNFFYNPKDYDPSSFNGETYPELIKRVQEGLDKIIENHEKDDVVALVTHGVTLKAILKIVKNLSFEELGKTDVPKNTSLTIVNYDEKTKKYDIELFSDISHLEGVK